MHFLALLLSLSAYAVNPSRYLHCEVDIMGMSGRVEKLSCEAKVHRDRILLESDACVVDFGSFVLAADIENIVEKNEVSNNATTPDQPFLTVKINTHRKSKELVLGVPTKYSWRTPIDLGSAASTKKARLIGYEFVEGMFKKKRYTRADYNCWFD